MNKLSGAKSWVMLGDAQNGRNAIEQCANSSAASQIQASDRQFRSNLRNNSARLPTRFELSLVDYSAGLDEQQIHVLGDSYQCEPREWCGRDIVEVSEASCHAVLKRGGVRTPS